MSLKSDYNSGQKLQSSKIGTLEDIYYSEIDDSLKIVFDIGDDFSEYHQY